LLNIHQEKKLRFVNFDTAGFDPKLIWELYSGLNLALQWIKWKLDFLYAVASRLDS